MPYWPTGQLFVFLQQVTFYGSKLRRIGKPEGEAIDIDGASQTAIVHSQGMTLFGNDGKMVRLASNFHFVNFCSESFSHDLVWYHPINVYYILFCEIPICCDCKTITLWPQSLNSSITLNKIKSQSKYVPALCQRITMHVLLPTSNGRICQYLYYNCVITCIITSTHASLSRSLR